MQTTLGFGAYNLVFLEELRPDFLEKKVEIGWLKDALSYQTSQIDLVTNPIQKTEIIKRMDDVVNDLLGDDSIDVVFNR